MRQPPATTLDAVDRLLNAHDPVDVLAALALWATLNQANALARDDADSAKASLHWSAAASFVRQARKQTRQAQRDDDRDAPPPATEPASSADPDCIHCGWGRIGCANDATGCRSYTPSNV